MLVKSLLVAGAAAFSFSNELENEKLSPAQRVVKLLREMKSQLEDEASKDAEIANKLECWCKTNTAEKEAAIKSADARSDELTAAIEENAAKKAKNEVIIKKAKKDIAKLRSALQKATSIREKETAEFRATETEMVMTVTNLQNAIAVLSKHQAGLLQMTPEVKQAVSAVIHSASEKHEELFGKKPEAKKAAGKAAFLQAENKEQAVFLQAVYSKERPVLSEHSAARLISSFVDTTAAPHLGNYQSQSGSIFGILTSMLDNFKASMTDAQKQEADAQAAYVELKAASEEQIAATSDALAQAKQEFADASKTLADSKEELEKTRDVRAADVEFLRNLKLQCNDIDAQWAARQQERADETAAVAEAIAVLMDDDNRELLAKTVSFITISMTKAMQEERRSRAAAVLRAASRKSPTWDDLSFQWQGQRKPDLKDIKPKQDLAVIAAQVQLDAFTKVKKAMDEMSAQIKSQMAEDVKHRDFCVSEFSQNGKNTQKKTHESEDLSAKIDDLASQIAALAEEIAQANKAVADTQVEIKKAGEDREAENALFQTEVQEQRATQVVLQKALDKLNQYYAKKDAFLQTSNKLKQTPPVAFTPYNSNAGASPVLALIGKIVEDSKAIEAEAMKDEQTAQANYETFVADSNTSIKNLQAEIASNSEAKANKEEDKVNTETAKADAVNELEMLANYKADLHQSCDFVMKNFEVRQQAMTNEIEAIQEAKAILSGAK
jgi:hypothetical protein